MKLFLLHPPPSSSPQVTAKCTAGEVQLDPWGGRKFLVFPCANAELQPQLQSHSTGELEASVARECAA